MTTRLTMTSMLQRLAHLLLVASSLALPVAARPQTQQSVQIVLKVPVRLTHVFPEVTDVQMRCRVWDATSIVGDQVSAWTPVSQLQRGTDGSLSGEISVTVPVTVTTGNAGKPGTYQCYLMGKTAQAEGTFATTATNPHFQIVTATFSAEVVKGTFTF